MKPILIFTFSFLLFTLGISFTSSAQCENDTIPPSAFSVSLATAVLDSDTYEVEVYAIDFFITSSDNCTPEDSLRFTFTNTPPEGDYTFQEEYMSSTKIYDCIDAVNSPVIVELYVWDLAGNSSYQTINMTIVPSGGSGCEGCSNDTVAPELELFEDLTWSFPVGAESVEIWASDFVKSADDNCTANPLIQYSFTPVSPFEDPSSSFAIFDCYDYLNSPIEVVIYAWDKSGNYTMGTSTLGFQSFPDPGCTELMMDVTGQVLNLKNEPIPGATIYLKRGNDEILESTVTNEQGEYSFYTNTYNKFLTAEYEDASLQEISFLDMIAMQKHLLGLVPFSGPQQLAADLNEDGRVRVNDLRMIRKIILGILPMEDYISTEWQFIDQEYDFQNNSEIQKNNFPIEGATGPTIIGYRLGDFK